MNWLSKGVHSRERGAALIIVLAFVVLLTSVGIAYLSRATSDRQVAHSSFNQSNVDQLAQSAMETIIGDLRQEIANGSANLALPGETPAYSPSPSPAAGYMIPQRSGNAAVAANLIRRSVRSDVLNGNPGMPSRASAVNSTTDISGNGRSVSLARWNTHYLLPKYNTLTDDSYPPSPLLPPFNPNPAVPNGFTPPDWVFVTTAGATPSPAPANVIGRYAYAIYDEGGLLDMNVAGYPTNTTATQSGRKGSVAFADLTALGNYPIPNGPPPPGTAYQVDKIVGWRNCASAEPNGNFPNFTFTAGQATNYVNFVLSNSNGFMTVSPNVWVSGSGGGNAAKRTDQNFVQRQQLIALRKDTLFSPNALQYLSTFSRETNSPSFSPSTPPGSTIDYAALASTPTAVNPNFLLRRVTTSFTRFDGTTAVVGEPLVKTRFPLSRLAWLTYKGPSASLPVSDPAITQLTNPPNNVPLATIQAGTAANIKACFGLVWDSRVPIPGGTNIVGQQWVYDSPSSANTGGNFDPVTNQTGNPASDIKRLDVVASENREPDFFELLRATMLDGSIGQNTGGGVTGGATIFPDIHMSNKALHILTIGACVIDQADPDSIPTRIELQPTGATTWWAAYGVESLPYITQIYPISGFRTSTTWATYLLFQLWNPHIGTALPTSAPQVRLRLDGNIGIFSDDGNGRTWTTATNKQSFTIPPTGVSVTQIPLTSGALPPGSTPAPLLTPAPAATAPPVGSATLPGFERLPPPSTGGSLANYIGLRLPDFLLGAGSPAAPVLSLYFGSDSTHPFNATMEYNVPGSSPPVWVSYNRFIGINDPASWINGDTIPVRNAGSSDGTPDSTRDQFNTSRLNDAPLPDCLMKADPRATRFGIFQFRAGSSWATTRITDPLWPTDNLTVPNGYGGTITDPAPASPTNGIVEHAPLRFSIPGGGNGIYFPATLCVNNAASTSTRTGYADNDGIVRPADAIYPDPSDSTTGSSTPYYVTGTAASKDYHPIILNRPLRNVAELGYAFRDLPWKTLDFFTDKSADAGLLDVFCINDGAQVLDALNNVVGMAVPATVAGQVNLNSTQPADIQSALAGAILDELDATNTVPKTGTGFTAAPVLAANIVTATTTTPLQNRSELLTRSGLPLAILPLPTGGAHNQSVKTRREVVPRAIASLSQARTWNLLIDVIAQSGRYPPNATSLSNGFVVNGEQHYWVHVAIDRFTGQVIDKQIEVVKE